MPILLDLLLAALLLVPAFFGWRRGFLGATLRLGRLALAFLAATLLGPNLAAYLNRRFVYPAVHESVSARFESLAEEVASSAQNGVGALADRVPSVFRPYLDLQNLNPAAGVHTVAREWAETSSERISHVLAIALGYLAVFAMAFILLTVAIYAVGGLIRHIPLVRTADRILGLTAGILAGGIAVLLLSTLLAALLSVTGRTDLVESSLMLRLSAGVREGLLG